MANSGAAPALDAARLAPFRLLDHARRHPTFAQAVSVKNEIAGWSLDRLRTLQSDLVQLNDEASKRATRLQTMLQYLTDVSNGITPSEVTNPLSLPSPVGSPRDLDADDFVDVKKGGNSLTSPSMDALNKTKRKFDSDDGADDVKRRKSESESESNASAGVLKLSFKIDGGAADSSSSSATASSDAHHFSGKGPSDSKAKGQQSQRRRRSSKAASSSRNVAPDAPEEAGTPVAVGTPTATSASSASAADDTPAANRASKNTQSVPFETFRNFIDPYVRPYTDAELDFLEPMEETDPYPFIIPPLGKHYLDVWAEESGESPTKPPTRETESGGVGFLGTLSERLVAALVEEGYAVPSSTEEDDATSTPNGVVPSMIPASDLENRIRRELAYVGLLDDVDETIAGPNETQDDEICVQLRILQQQLRQQMSINATRKAKLYARVRAHLGHQEYEEVLSELHSQIEAGYARRQKQVQPRGGKKKGKAAATTRVRPPVPEDLRQLIARADRLPKMLATVFPPGAFVSPTTSIYDGGEAVPNPDWRGALAAVALPSKIVSDMVAKESNAIPSSTIVGRG